MNTTKHERWIALGVGTEGGGERRCLMTDEGSSLRSRATRRQHAPQESSSQQDDDAEQFDDSAGASWKQEMESIVAGTHPLLVEGLDKHEQVMKAQIAQAERIRRLQTVNINNLFDCDKKQAEDEKKAQLEFFQSRLIDSIEAKRRKLSRESGFGLRRKSADGVDAQQLACKRRQIGGLTGLDISYALTAEEAKSDLDEIMSAAERYSIRTAAIVSDDLRVTSSGGGDAYFDRARQQLHCNGHTFEREAKVYVFQQGQRIEDVWTLTAMNAVEVTLRDTSRGKLKVTLAQLRSGRFVFRPRA
ncbi:hypothetical protein AB1Y20_004193 [Prymnesium parvum]|uniref:Non-structural maintenance of chromosomes element 4 n=1 Tax=Prymnesium parvum TaxID=97485 RepID=A0AB34J9S5_PRYPA